jgi:hypothetical protein
MNFLMPCDPNASLSTIILKHHHIATGYWLDGPGFDSALGPTQPPIQWVLGGFFPGGGVKRQGMKLTVHLHLVQRSRMVGLYFHSHMCLHGIVLN